MHFLAPGWSPVLLHALGTRVRVLQRLSPQTLLSSLNLPGACAGGDDHAHVHRGARICCLQPDDSAVHSGILHCFLARAPSTALSFSCVWSGAAFETPGSVRDAPSFLQLAHKATGQAKHCSPAAADALQCPACATTVLSKTLSTQCRVFWRYNVLYVSERCFESGGLFWDQIFSQVNVP